MPQGGWSVVYVDSQQTGKQNGVAANAIDGNPATEWITEWYPTSAPLPHEIQVNLGGSYTLSGFQYLARQDGCANGWIGDYNFYVSTDGVNWGTPVASGTFNYGTLSTSCPGAGIPPAMQVPFAPTTGQYVMLQGLSEVNGNPWTSVAELDLLGVVAGGQTALAGVAFNPAVVVGGGSATGVVTLNAPAPAGGAVVTLSSSNPSAAAVPASVTVLAGASTANFTVTTAAVTALTPVTVSAGYNGSQSATLTLDPGAIPHVGWSVIYADSQEETASGNGAAVDAIDGNPATSWITQWYPTSAPLPHEIQVNLGASYTLNAFQYLARQDGCANGWIKDYQFYVSTDGVNWGSPVASGTFNYGTLSTTCPGAGVPGVMQVAFPATTGQYIMLQALSEVNGNPWTAVAELNVLGDAVLAGVNLNPGVLVGGNPSTGTVALSGLAPAGGAVVSLSSSNSSVAAVPASVTVPAGQSTAVFPVTTSSVAASTQATITGSYNISQSANLTVVPAPVPESTWTVIYTDSQETHCQNGAAENAIDGNPATMWVTQWCGANPPPPHEIQVYLGGWYALSAFQYLARQDGCANGWIKDFDFYVSSDGVNWGNPVASGTFSYGNLSTSCPHGGIPPVLQVEFPTTVGQYVQLRGLSEINGNPWTAVAELSLLGAPQPPQLQTITVTPASVAGGSPATGSVSLNEAAPAGGAAVALSSSSASVLVPSSVLVPEGATTASFPVSTALVTGSTTVAITGTYNGSQSAMLTLNASALPKPGWSVIYADSQETKCQNGAAANAIDGNPATMWVTQWCPTSAPLPHEIQINLGAPYQMGAFQYLPRQDGCANGWIGDYNFYVSTDGVNWGTPVATGAFNYGSLSTSCPGAGVPPAMQVNFPPVTVQYIMLQALSEINGHAWTSAAEISVLGDLQPALVVSASSLSFPAQLVNTSSNPMSITLTNVGLSPIGFTGIAASGDFSQTNNCGASLAVLSSCSIIVTFTPTAAGSRSGSLSIANNAAGSAQQIALSGSGIAPTGAVPALIQHVSGSSTRNNSFSSPFCYFYQLPGATTAGNSVVVGFTFLNSPTPTVTDDKGDVYTIEVNHFDSTDGVSVAIAAAFGVAAGARVISVCFSADPGGYVQPMATEFDNVTGIDGPGTGSQGTGVAVTAGSLTPSVSGDLVYQVVASLAPRRNESSFTAGSESNITWNLLSADLMDGLAAQFGVYNSTASINPTMTMGTSQDWASAAVLLQSGSSGSVPAGMRIVHLVHENVPEHAASGGNGTPFSNPLSLQFPSSGNLLVAMVGGGNNSETVVSMTDSNNNNWSQAGATQVISGNDTAQAFYAGKATSSSTLALTLNWTASNGDFTIFFYDVAGAATTPLDTAVGSTGTQSTAGSLTMPFTVTPTMANEIIFSQVIWDFNTATGVVGQLFDTNTFSGESLSGPEPVDENNGWGHIITTTTGTVGFTWTEMSPTLAVGDWAGMAVAFKASN